MCVSILNSRLGTGAAYQSEAAAAGIVPADELDAL